MRFFKHGPLEVVRSLLDVRDNLNTDTEERLRLVAEVRSAADRPWEDFDEGILRWGIPIVLAPVVGEFNAFAVRAPENLVAGGAGGTRFVRGSIISIDEVCNFSAGGINWSLTTMAALDATLTINAGFTFWKDARWSGTGLGPVPGVQTMFGSDPAGFGSSAVGALPTNQRAVGLGVVLGGSLLGFVISGSAVNQSMDLRLSGRLWVPRE